MKVGVLTFHSQLNYGGVLQALAMQMILRELGHDVKIIDCWLRPNNSTLTLKPQAGIKAKIRRCLELILCVGWHKLFKRGKRTQNFIAEHLNLTAYHFLDWSMAPHDLDIDCIVVGSDQVWGCYFSNPSAYLLENAPKIPAISYAASIGMSEFPAARIEQYKKGFSRFAHILVRENQAQRMIEDLGFTAHQVLDPTLLVSETAWRNELKISTHENTNRIFCYFLRLPIKKTLQMLIKLANDYDLCFDVLINSTVRDLPRNRQAAKNLWDWWTCPRDRRVKLRITDGPVDFVRRIASSRFVISDSFHALMFATIFEKNVRILSPITETGKRMFARIEEFDKKFYSGVSIISNSITGAVQSFISGDYPKLNSIVLQKEQETSRNKLISALASL